MGRCPLVAARCAKLMPVTSSRHRAVIRQRWMVSRMGRNRPSRPRGSWRRIALTRGTECGRMGALDMALAFICVLRMGVARGAKVGPRRLAHLGPGIDRDG